MVLFLKKKVVRWLVVRLLPRRPRFDPRPVDVTYVADKVTLGQTFRQVVWISPVSTTTTRSHTQSFLYNRGYINVRNWQRR